jgi:hypothetical protein
MHRMHMHGNRQRGGCMPGAPPMKRILHSDWLAVVNRPMQRGGLGMRLAHLLPQSLSTTPLAASGRGAGWARGRNKQREGFAFCLFRSAAAIRILLVRGPHRQHGGPAPARGGGSPGPRHRQPHV